MGRLCHTPERQLPSGAPAAYNAAHDTRHRRRRIIGSYLLGEIYARSPKAVVADRLGTQWKWRNIAMHPPSRLVAPGDLDACMARDAKAEFTETPPALMPHYQSLTEALIMRMRAAGTAKDFTNLEDGIGGYELEHLRQPNSYR